MSSAVPEQAVERDIVERLRNRREMINYGHGNVADVPDDDCMEAADEIERLRLLVRVQHPEDVAREEVAFLLDRLDDFEREIQDDDLAREWSGHVTPAIARFRAALPHAGQPQEGWRRDYENAPSEAYEFFLVRQAGLHPGFGKPFIPVIVQQIDGQLFAPDNEIEPLIFGHGQPKPDWHDAGLEWRPLPADWLSAAPASPRAEGEWRKVENAKPRPHNRYQVFRDANVYTATPCYGMHAPWWVPQVMNGFEGEPVNMLDTDLWRPLPAPPHIAEQREK